MKIRLYFLRLFLLSLWTTEEGFFPVVERFNEMIDYRRDIKNKIKWKIPEL